MTTVSPRKPSARPVVWSRTSAATVSGGRCRAAATRGDCRPALATEMSGSLSLIHIFTEHADGEFERRVEDWRHRHPELRVHPITTEFAIASFLSIHDERIQLAVISGDEADQLAQLVGPSGHPLFRHPECSVLVLSLIHI